LPGEVVEMLGLLELLRVLTDRTGPQVRGLGRTEHEGTKWNKMSIRRMKYCNALK
jgi:hypothetical protein